MITLYIRIWKAAVMTYLSQCLFGQENHETSARRAKSQKRHVPHIRLQPCHYNSLPDLIMFSREI
jgi:hypothetical protein